MWSRVIWIRNGCWSLNVTGWSLIPDNLVKRKFWNIYLRVSLCSSTVYSSFKQILINTICGSKSLLNETIYKLIFFFDEGFSTPFLPLLYIFYFSLNLVTVHISFFVVRQKKALDEPRQFSFFHVRWWANSNSLCLRLFKKLFYCDVCSLKIPT